MRTLLGNDEIINAMALDVFREYNTDQMIYVNLPEASGQVTNLPLEASRAAQQRNRGWGGVWVRQREGRGQREVREGQRRLGFWVSHARTSLSCAGFQRAGADGGEGFARKRHGCRLMGLLPTVTSLRCVVSTEPGHRSRKLGRRRVLGPSHLAGLRREPCQAGVRPHNR